MTGLRRSAIHCVLYRSLTERWTPFQTELKELFGSVAIHWMAVDIHFFGGYPLFGLDGGGDRDNHFCLKMMVEHIPPNLLDELNHFWLASIASPEPFYS
jgi:hypothetical protein